MRNTNSSNEYSRTIKESSNTMINNTLLKLRTIIAIGVLISLSACTGYTLNSSEVGSELPSYPVIQF